MALSKGKGFDLDSAIDSMTIMLETEFVKERAYTDFIDWYYNGGIDLDAFGITLTEQQMLIPTVFYGLPLSDKQLSILQYWAGDRVNAEEVGRTTYDFELGPCERQFLIIELGRRSGKTLVCSIVTVYEFEQLCRMKSPQKELGIASNSPISFVMLASSATQAEETIFYYVKGMIKLSPYLKRLVDNGDIELLETEVRYKKKGLTIISGNSKAESQVGGNVYMLVLDEAAMFNAKNGENNALKLWNDLGAGGAPFGYKHKRLALSSAGYYGDAMVKLYESASRSQAWVGFRLKSWQVNPIQAGRDTPVIDAMYIDDYKRAQLLFEGIRSAAVNSFFDMDAVNKAFNINTKLYARELPIGADNLTRLEITQMVPLMGYYVMHIDPASVSDSFGLAFGHTQMIEGFKHVFIDGILAWVPKIDCPVSFMNVSNIITEIGDYVPIAKLTSDGKDTVEMFQRFKSLGWNVSTMSVANAAQYSAYDTMRTLMSEGRLHLPKNSPWTNKLKSELMNIELVNNNKITHGADGKDIADCVAHVCINLVGSISSALPAFSTSFFNKNKVEPVMQPDKIQSPIFPFLVNNSNSNNLVKVNKDEVIRDIRANRSTWRKH